MPDSVLVIATTAELAALAAELGFAVLRFPDGLRHHHFNSKTAHVFLVDSDEPGWLESLQSFASRPRLPYRCVVVGDSNDVAAARPLLREQGVAGYLARSELATALREEIEAAAYAAETHYQDLAERDALARQAFTDSLTGLANRAAWDRDLKELATNPPPGRSVAAFLDLVGFKQINDTHGQDAGDRALQTFARALRKAIRRSDTAYRHGGDEFMVLFRGMSAKEGGLERGMQAIERKLLALLAAVPVTLETGEVTVGTRLVLSPIPTGNWDPASLYRHLADKLSTAKQAEKQA